MKKKLSLVLAILMMIGVITPLGVYADVVMETDISTSEFAQEEVDKYVPKIKRIFDIGDEYDEFDLHKSSHRGETTYNLMWRSLGDNDHINVNIDPDGNIIRYSKYKSSDREEHSKFPKISKEEALKKAKEIISKVEPSLLENIQYNDESVIGDLNGYYFRFQRMENDIPFIYNSVSVHIDNTTGELESLNIDWDGDIKLPNKDNIIKKEKAFNLYKEGQGAELEYRLNNKEDKLEGKLLYTLKDKNRAIDSKTGKKIENLNNMNDYIHYGFLFGNMKKVSVEDAKELLNSKKIISKKEAGKSLREFADLDKSYEIQGSNLKKSKIDENYIWNISIHKQEGNSGWGTNVSVDAKTGEVLSFHRAYMGEDRESKYSEEEALKKAHGFLEEKMPDKYKEVEYGGSNFYNYDEDIREYHFTFTRVKDGVKIPQNGFSLSVSAATGEIMNYNHSWMDIEIPSRKNLIPEEKARKILLDNGKLELHYIVDKESIKNKEKEIKLVYNLNTEESTFVDPKTGETISQKELYDNHISQREKEYKDIDKSYAKDEIKKLKENGIFIPGEDFKPKEDITQKDFLYLLSSTKRFIPPYDEEYIYDELSRHNVIRKGEKAPDKTITRAEAVKYVVRSFGQEKAASFGDMYKSNYEDIDNVAKELKGYIAVAEGLGVISGSGNFRADDNLTRQEAAMIAYNILNRD